MENVFKPALCVLAILFAASNLFGQTSYSGFVGESPVTMVTDIYSDGVANAIYVYDNFDEPIRLEGKLIKKRLTFLEKYRKKLTRATLTFDNFDTKNAEMKGIWRDSKTGETLDITLKKDFETESGENGEPAEREIIQADAINSSSLTATAIVSDICFPLPNITARDLVWGMRHVTENSDQKGREIFTSNYYVVG